MFMDYFRFTVIDLAKRRMAFSRSGVLLASADTSVFGYARLASSLGHTITLLRLPLNLHPALGLSQGTN
jgi:hypothetical protein